MRRARALEALVGAHDADVVPHQPADLVPVVADDDRLVRASGLAGVPGRDARRARRRSASLARRRRRGARTPAPRAASSRPGGWRRAARSGHLADGVEAGHVGAPALVDDHAAAACSAPRAPPGSAACHVDAEAACSARRCWGSARPGSRRRGGSCRAARSRRRCASSRRRWRAPRRRAGRGPPSAW